MQGLLIPLSFAVWIGIWVLVVKKRGRLRKVPANLLGALAGLICSTLFLSAVLPEPPHTESVAARDATPEKSQELDNQEKPQELDSQEADVPSAAIDRITMLYLNHKIYPNDPTLCEPKRVGGRDMVGCRAQQWGGYSQVHVWEYSQGKFKSINGSARTLAEGKFANENDVEASPLPLPSDINVDTVVKAFTKG